MVDFSTTQTRQKRTSLLRELAESHQIGDSDFEPNQDLIRLQRNSKFAYRSAHYPLFVSHFFES